MSAPARPVALDPRPGGSRSPRLALTALAALLVGTAWLNDDSYFTLRTVQNFLAGEGLRWNLFERVQAYTHPLWMFLLAAAMGLTHEHFLTTIAVCIACTLAACAVLVGPAGPARGRVEVVALLLLSRAFVDFGTGGLENPLGFLLAALFLRAFLRPERTPGALAWLACWAALAALTRLDSVLLYLPALVLRTLESVRAHAGTRRAAWSRTVGALLLGFAPLAAWELFSCFYYGFPFPNTAYAKLGAGIPRAELALQGLWYLLDSLRRDAPTLLTIAAGCGLALVRAPRRLGALALGVLAYLAYVVSIGGDYMSGRFLALPFFLAVGLLGAGPAWVAPSVARRAWPLAFVLGLYLHQVTLALRDHTARPLGLAPEMSVHGIEDARFSYYHEMGLLRPSARFQPEPPLPWVVGPKGVALVYQGRQAFQAGPGVVALESWGLADPLLARLPARYDYFWRIGHFERFLPLGYEETLGTGVDCIEDRGLAEYHRHLRLVTAGPLFSLERLRTALALNLGRYDALLRFDEQRYALRRRGVLQATGAGTWRAERGLGLLGVEGALYSAEQPLRMRRITIELAELGLGAVLLCDGERVVREFVHPAIDAASGRCVLEADGTLARSIWLLPARRAKTRVTGLELTVD